MTELAQTDAEPRTAIAPEILAALDKLDKRKSELLDLQEAVEVAREAKARFPELSLGSPAVDANHRSGWGDISMFAFTSNIADLQPLLAFLASAGYRQSATPRDIPEMQMRMWLCGPISLLVMLGKANSDSSDGKTCRFVEIGKKEVPIYELKCE